MLKLWKRVLIGITIILFVVNTTPTEGQSLPPEQVIDNLNAIAGTWNGTLKGPRNNVPYRLTIREDGTWKAVSQNGVSGGTVQIVSQRVIFESRTTGRKGVYRLFEGKGERFLVLEGDGSVTAQLEPLRD